jgi:hypothetical protein
VVEGDACECMVRTMAPRYSVNHYSAYFCGDVYCIRLIFKLVDFEQTRLPFIMWL